ncbi:MAG: hypothetical protein GY697_20765 [Desulfobacterales bacterium]|nr:hypothetical protein [Desulfobacterales bacterium]
MKYNAIRQFIGEVNWGAVVGWAVGAGWGMGNFLRISPAKPPQTGTLSELKAQAAQLQQQMEK